MVTITLTVTQEQAEELRDALAYMGRAYYMPHNLKMFLLQPLRKL